MTVSWDHNASLSERLGTQAGPSAQGKSAGRMATGAVTLQRHPTRSENDASPHGNPQDAGVPATNLPPSRATLVRTLSFRALQPGRVRIVA